MLKVNRDFCLGCGLCIEVCPQGAINLAWDKAEIDIRRCNSCYRCLKVCPRGAIFELVTITPEELKFSVASLEQQTDDIITRINRLAN